jgi:hypothetical protein
MAVLKMLKLYFYRLLNADHYEYLREFRAMIAEAGAFFKSTVANLLPPFDTALAKEKALVEWERGSALTPLIAEADDAVDKDLIVIRKLVDVAVYGGGANGEAGKRLKIALGHHGNITRKRYLAELGEVFALIDSLLTTHAADVALLGLGPQVSKLKADFDSFAALLKERDSQRENKPAGTFPAVRKEIEASYHELEASINSGARLGLSQDFGMFITKINPLIARTNTQSERKPRKDIALAQPEGIPNQLYNGGRRITPIPKVFYVTPEGNIELVLGLDFTVSYKNNCDVGVATLIIKGINSYKGKLAVTFMIERA